MASLLQTIRDRAPRPSVGFDLLRIYLGVALFVRGALFVSHPERVQALVEKSGDWFMPMMLAHFVAVAHLGGGLLLALGLATRLAAVVQIPVLTGAVFLVHWDDGLLNPSQSLELAGLVLAMLVSYAVCGAGSLSLDALLARPPRKRFRPELGEPTSEAEAHDHIGHDEAHPSLP